MPEANALILQMSADIRGLQKQMAKARGTVDTESRAMEKRAKELEKRFERIGESIGTGIRVGSRIAGIALAGIIGYSIKAAASATELRNAFEVAFGAGAKGAEDYAKALSEKVGRSQLEIMESMTRFRLLLKDQAPAVAESLTQALQERAIDVGSLFNLKDADVIQKFFSGLSGESEPLKALGVNLNEAALKAELLRLGFKGNTTAASETAKQIARANIIMRETQIAAGDAAKTIDSTANQLKKLQGEARDSAAELGNRFLPVANRLLGWANDAIGAFNGMPVAMQNAGLAMLALVAAAGPIARLIAGLSSIITTARLAGVTLAGIGLGAATGAATAGAGSVLLLSGDTRQTAKVSDQERLNNLIKTEVGLRAQAAAQDAKGRAKFADDLRAQADQTAAAARGLRLKLGAQALLTGGAQADVPGLTRPPGELALTEAQKLAVGGAGAGAKGRTGPTAQEIADKKQLLEWQLKIDVAKAAGDEAAVQALQDQIYLLQTIRDLEEAGIANAATRAQEIQDAIKAGRQSVFNREFGEAADAVRKRRAGEAMGKFFDQQEIDRQAREVFDAMDAEIGEYLLSRRQAEYDATYNGIRSGLEAIADGDAMEFFARALRNAVLHNLSDALTNALQGFGQGTGGGFGGFLRGAGKFLGIPGFASGTSSFGGGFAKINEAGSEGVAFLPPNTQIIPNDVLRGLANLKANKASQPVIVQQFHLHTEGAVMTSELLREMDAKATRAAAFAGRAAHDEALRATPSRLMAFQNQEA